MHPKWGGEKSVAMERCVPEASRSQNVTEHVNPSYKERAIGRNVRRAKPVLQENEKREKSRFAIAHSGPGRETMEWLSKNSLTRDSLDEMTYTTSWVLAN